MSVFKNIKWDRQIYLALLVLINCLLLSATVKAAPASSIELQDASFSALSNGRVQVDLQFSAPVTSPKSFSTEKPSRVIFDFWGVSNGLKDNKIPVAIGFLDMFEVMQADKRTRILLSLKQSASSTIKIKENHVYIVLSGKSELGLTAAKKHFVSNPWANTKHSVNAIDFHADPSGSGRVVVSLSDASMGITVSDRGADVVIDFIDTAIAKRLERRLDVTDFRTPIQAIKTRTNGGNVQMVVSAIPPFQHLAYQVNHQFVIDISPEGSIDDISKAKQAEPTYTGERLSLNFQDIQVRSVLQLLAEFTGINIVASDSVKGSLTLRLNNIPWDEALAIILKTQGLAQRKVGNVLMIAPANEIAAREKDELESKRAVKELEPLHTELMQLNYAKAEEISFLLKDESTSLLSPRGNVSVDVRTNTLLVQDTPYVLDGVRDLVARLDVPVQQVLIEARIVNVDTDFEKDLGIRWGITQADHVTGTLDGANSMVQNVLDGDHPLADVPVAQRLNVNLGAIPVAGQAASVGVALANLGKGYLLDLEISALESEGVGELISSPRLVTANQQPAYIEQGEEIPYQEKTSSGATAVEFKKAVLALRVIPQITPDGKVIMDLKLNQDRRSSEPEVLGVPAIDTQQIETRVLVDNGQTIVLGGVYKEMNLHSVTRVPFLGSLPVVGSLFRQTSEKNDRSELLIFITPKIIQQATA